MSKDYSDVTRMSVMDPNQFRLRMLWPGSGAAGTAVCRVGDGRRAAGRASRRLQYVPAHSGIPGRNGTGHTPGSRDGTAPVTLWGPRDGTAPVTLRDPGTGRPGHTPGPRDGTARSHSGTPGRGRHRSHSGISGRDGTGHTLGPRDGTGHTPGPQDGTAPVTPWDPGTSPVTHRLGIDVTFFN